MTTIETQSLINDVERFRTKHRLSINRAALMSGVKRSTLSALLRGDTQEPGAKTRSKLLAWIGQPPKVDAPTDLFFVDFETTGLDPTDDGIWEASWAVAQVRGGDLVVETFVSAFVHPSTEGLRRIQYLPESFRVDFARRFNPDASITLGALSTRLRTALKGLNRPTIVGCVPSFDVGFMQRWLPVSWHHRLVCVETLAAGYLGTLPRFDPNDLAKELGVKTDDLTKHQAADDVLFAMRMFAAVYDLDIKFEFGVEEQDQGLAVAA